MKRYFLFLLALGTITSAHANGDSFFGGGQAKGELNSYSAIKLYDPQVYHSPEWWLFDPREIQITAGYNYVKSQGRNYLDDDEGDGFFVSGDYYINRFFAIGGDYSHMSSFFYDHHLGTHLKLRLPWDGAGLAFYLLGGVGASFGSGEWNDEVDYSIGIGVELRLLDNMSMSFDIRAVETASDLDYYRANYGVSILF